jgi:hypothetical protein
LSTTCGPFGRDAAAPGLPDRSYRVLVLNSGLPPCGCATFATARPASRNAPGVDLTASNLLFDDLLGADSVGSNFADVAVDLAGARAGRCWIPAGRRVRALAYPISVDACGLDLTARRPDGRRRSAPSLGIGIGCSSA